MVAHLVKFVVQQRLQHSQRSLQRRGRGASCVVVRRLGWSGACTSRALKCARLLLCPAPTPVDTRLLLPQRRVAAGLQETSGSGRVR